jgi:glycosyltransferase involved in cell wall biosynthesis
MKHPLVSITIFSYNQSSYICAAIDSVINQTYTNLEIIIVDNGSTDGSKDLIQKYLSDKRVVFLNHAENKKFSIRQNEACALSNGKYIGILYADDYYLLDKIEKQVNLFETLDDSYGVVHGPGLIEKSDTTNLILSPCSKVSGFCFNSLLDQWSDGFCNPISPLARRQCYIEYPADEEVFFGGGEGLFLFFALRYQFYYFDEALVVMRNHEKNAGKRVKSNTDAHNKLMTRLIHHKEVHSESIPHIQKHSSYFKMNTAWHILRTNDDLIYARDLYLQALKLYPKNLLNFKRLLGFILSFCPSLLVRFFNRGALLFLRKQHFYGIE